MTITPGELIVSMKAAVEQVIADERERCAQIVEELLPKVMEGSFPKEAMLAAIRAGIKVQE